MTDLQVVLAIGGVVAAIVAFGLLFWIAMDRCTQCGAPPWQQVDFDNPQLSPTAPILRRCKRCGHRSLTPL